MSECFSCGTEVPGGANFCVSCGKRVPRCPACGGAHAPRSRFCGACGAALEGSQERETVSSAIDVENAQELVRLERQLESEFAREVGQEGVGILYRIDRPILRSVVGRGETKIGAGPRNDVAVDEPAISWNHALISWRDGALALRDTASTNGTFLNGLRVSSPRKLVHGDTITFATTKMRLWLLPKHRA